MTVSTRFPPPPGDGYGHPHPWSSTIRPMLLHDMFAGQALKSPSAPLVDFMGRTYSYRELHVAARRFAAGLAERGIAKGDRIGLFLPNVPSYVAAYYGAMMAGAVVVNFSPLYSVEELAAQVVDSGTRVLVTLDAPALLPTACKVLDASPLEQLIVVRLADELPRLKSLGLRVLKRSQIARLLNRSDINHWGDWLGDETHAEPPALAPSDLALLQYTGGTTGVPKGAMLTHANLSSNAQQIDLLDPFERGERDVILGALPLFHVFANTCVLNRTVVRGGSMVLLPRFDAGQVLAAINRVRPTSFPGVPTMFQALMDHRSFSATDWTSLRICISGGAPLPQPLCERFEAATGARLVEGYGLTESAGVVSTNPYVGARKVGTIGQPIPATQLLLLDKEDPSRLAPDGEPGELAIRGPQVMRGYWNKPDSHAAAYAEINGESWLRTGDVATIDAEGYVAIVDRLKDMIAVSGFKVFPSHVEDVLLTHPAIREVLVIGVPDDYHGEVPRAYATLAAGADATGDTLKSWLNPRIGKHERVDAVVVRSDLPKTMIGKLDRKALRAEVL